ncbi:MAG: response regulator [Thermodesulfobacteriota bacterium]
MDATVLVVDDEIEFAQALAERLQLRRYNASACYGGKDAIEIIKHGAIDVVILDLMMPDMDGIETLKKIKEVKPLTEVIMLSGKATLKTAIEGMEQGAFEYLTKPCDNDLMIGKITEASLRKRKQEDRIRRAMEEIEGIILKNR